MIDLRKRLVYVCIGFALALIVPLCVLNKYWYVQPFESAGIITALLHHMLDNFCFFYRSSMYVLE